MRVTIAVLFLGIVFFTGCKGKSSSQTNLNQVEWLIGSWQRTNTKPGITAHERWEKASETELIGWGVATRNTDTTFIEKLRIVSKDGALFYVAEVEENPEPVYFKLTSIAADGFVSENQNHDFPKKIEYQLASDTLIATTSGGSKSFVFKFTRNNR